MAQKIERIDTIPIIIVFLEKMNVQHLIDSIFIPHGNWSGLSYGQLAVLFITYVLHSLTHHFSGVEAWVNQHKKVIERATGWKIREKDATDDRLGILSETLGNMVLLTIALQVMTLMAFVSRRELSQKDETIAGLVPGNPKMKTSRPSAERLLAQFGNLHLLITEKEQKNSGIMVETLTPLQKKILAILQLPEKIYELSFQNKKKTGIEK